MHIPIHELPTRLDEVPTDRPVWVHCAAGYRASIAASLLHRAGRDVVAIHDDYTAARRGYPQGGAARPSPPTAPIAQPTDRPSPSDSPATETKLECLRKRAHRLR